VEGLMQRYGQKRLPNRSEGLLQSRWGSLGRTIQTSLTNLVKELEIPGAQLPIKSNKLNLLLSLTRYLRLCSLNITAYHFGIDPDKNTLKMN
jgi:hypothetical protein